ncbi:XRE family transcriptional regulator [Streptomyces sp. NPDC020875]|uniref:XRE family transcriptional regulator n=1 Tax=Streptomyces sp. NPDC020875 TaxID=3154898 RepID=UPI0033FD4845
MEGNERLALALRERGFTQTALADVLNDYLYAVGHEGTVGDRTVRNWLTGKTKWPHPRQREALEAVFSCTAEELGFRPPARTGHPTTPREQPVKRRNFLTATTGTTAAVAVPLTGFTGAPSTVGTSDVIRLRERLDGLVALDQSRGGHAAVEKAALAGAVDALDKQKLAASQRIRQRLFSVAADFTASAAWNAIDAHRPNRAHDLLGKAVRLAGMSGDPVSEFEVWNLYAMLARQRGEYADAVDAAHAAQATAVTRRDPLFASLAHARTAVGQSYLGERQAALRSLGHAWEALDKSDPDAPRAAWMDFYGVGELAGLVGIVRNQLGDWTEAEAASHRSLANTPERFRRNRAMEYVSLAKAQLHQGDAELACATASTAFGVMGNHPLPGRLRSLIGDYYRDLLTLAPDAESAREWGDRYRSEWSRP